MWGSDMTETITVAEGVARVFIAVDHANSEVVGIHASKSGNRFEALEPIRQGVLRHDHSSNRLRKKSGKGGRCALCCGRIAKTNTAYCSPWPPARLFPHTAKYMSGDF